jgi:hypothetical protein
MESALNQLVTRIFYGVQDYICFTQGRFYCVAANSVRFVSRRNELMYVIDVRVQNK